VPELWLMHNVFFSTILSRGKNVMQWWKVLPSPQRSRKQLFVQKNLILWADEIEDVIFEEFLQASCHKKTKELQLRWGGRTWKPLHQVVQWKFCKSVQYFIHFVMFHLNYATFDSEKLKKML
jgi:hypothetical protein